MLATVHSCRDESGTEEKIRRFLRKQKSSRQDAGKNGKMKLRKNAGFPLKKFENSVDRAGMRCYIKQGK
jgi:hypothetical protein